MRTWLVLAFVFGFLPLFPRPLFSQSLPGTVGNDQPFVSVGESWYSQELGRHVLSTYSHPRTGETTERLTQIDRSEPDAALFHPPPGYTVLDQ